LENLDEVRQLWPRVPVALHVMSLVPRRWVEATWPLVDWYLLHLDAGDDVWELMFAARSRGKRVGVVWRPGNAFAPLLAFLPHVDFVMVLGIREPGRSGQSLCAEAVEVARALDRLRGRYRYEVMFDGGVRESNVHDIPARYIVAASAVLTADDPATAANHLRSAPYDRRRAA
jgi:ribulose-phosphate 3-epimerase